MMALVLGLPLSTEFDIATEASSISRINRRIAHMLPSILLGTIP